MKVAAATATHDTTARVADCCLVGLVVVYWSCVIIVRCFAAARLVSRAWLWGLMMGRMDPFEFS